MPQALVKQEWLIFEPFESHPEDVIWSPPSTSQADRNALQERVERILNPSKKRGRPVIQTASLRGPFDREWLNPWRCGPSNGYVSATNEEKGPERPHLEKGLAFKANSNSRKACSSASLLATGKRGKAASSKSSLSHGTERLQPARKDSSPKALGSSIFVQDVSALAWQEQSILTPPPSDDSCSPLLVSSDSKIKGRPGLPRIRNRLRSNPPTSHTGSNNTLQMSLLNAGRAMDGANKQVSEHARPEQDVPTLGLSEVSRQPTSIPKERHSQRQDDSGQHYRVLLKLWPKGIDEAEMFISARAMDLRGGPSTLVQSGMAATKAIKQNQAKHDAMRLSIDGANDSRKKPRKSQRQQRTQVRSQGKRFKQKKPKKRVSFIAFNDNKSPSDVVDRAAAPSAASQLSKLVDEAELMLGVWDLESALNSNELQVG